MLFDYNHNLIQLNQKVNDLMIIFDYGYNIRVFVYRGMCVEHMFGNKTYLTHNKETRLDLSIRNFFFKHERMDMIQKLINYNNSNIAVKVNEYYFNLANEVLSIHNSNSNVNYRIKDEIDFATGISKENLSFEILSKGLRPAHIGNLKFLNNTLISDISILFESNMNWLYVDNLTEFNNVTEKLTDNIIVGKPFIACSKFIVDFCKNNGFDDYSSILNIDYDSIFTLYTPNGNKDAYLKVNELLFEKIKEIAEMPENEYNLLKNRLLEAAEKNRQKCMELYEKCSILDNIINDYKLNYKQ